MPHPLSSIEIKKYSQNEFRLNGVYSRNTLPKNISYGAYATTLDKYDDVGTHWIALYVLNIGTICFDSFGVKHIPIET